MTVMSVKTSIEDFIPKAPNEIFSAIVKAETLKNFFVVKSSGDLIEGEEVHWDFGKFGGVEVSVTQLVMNRLIGFSWTATGKYTEVMITLTEKPESGETKVSITESGWPLDETGLENVISQTQGWQKFLDGLKAYLLFNVNLREGKDYN